MAAEKVEPKQRTALVEREIVLTRIFRAPRERVWKAWTDPAHIMKWWGPKHFTSPVCRADFRINGTYLFGMRSPEGKDFWSTGTYREIVPLERIVYTDNFCDEFGNILPPSAYGMPGEWPEERMVTVTFEDLGGRTSMMLKHVGLPKEMGDLAGAGWSQSLDKLEDSLHPGEDDRAFTAATTFEVRRSERTIVIARLLDAPRELVFRACTDRTLIPQWWGPRHLTTIVEHLDVKPGGTWRIIQRDGQGHEYAFHGVYREVAAPSRIVRTFNFEGMAGRELLETVALDDHHGKARITVTTTFQHLEDLEGMLEAGMQGGAVESMERLSSVLAEQLAAIGRERRDRPTLANGKICYLELPAKDIGRSAAFYRDVFGWGIRTRGDGSTAFDDTVGEVSGSWILHREAAPEPGLLFYIMVDDIRSTMEAAVAHGGEIVQDVGGDAPEITARFRDPGGNIIGLYQPPETH